MRRPSCRHRRSAHVWVEKLEQGPEKSGFFCCLLRWSVGRHGLLRSLCIHSRQRLSISQSALTLIAFKAENVEIAKDVPCVICLFSIKGLVIFIAIPTTAFAVTIWILNALAEVNFSTCASFGQANQMVLGQDQVPSGC